MFTAAGVIVSLLALLVRRSEALSDLDAAAARWAHEHTSALGHDILSGISLLASTEGVIVIGLVAGIIEMIRVPSRWIPVFLIVVPVGDSLVTNTVKGIIDRARPAIDPAAASLGPSFPSGHSSTAAAFYAALALLAWRRRPAHVRNVLAGAAVGIAVAVACSRVLLDLHWLSDVDRRARPGLGVVRSVRRRVRRDRSCASARRSRRPRCARRTRVSARPARRAPDRRRAGRPASTRSCSGWSESASSPASAR